MNIYCPDGMDCPWWPICHDDKPEDDLCPLLNRDPERTEPIDKQIERW